MLAIRVLKDGVPVREQIFTSTPVRIGRSEGSDLILTDPSVSREHATLMHDERGVLMIIDGSGTNGLYAGPRRVESESFSGRLRARLGLTEIEIEEVSAAATQEISLEDLHHLDQRRTPLTWVKYLGIALAAVTFEAVFAPEFWSPWNSQRAVGLVTLNAGALVAIVVASSMLLGLLKAVHRKVRVADVLHHFAFFGWLRPLALVISAAAYYLVPDGLSVALHAWLPSLALLAFLAQATTLRRPPPNRTFRLLWALAFLVILIGVEFTHSYATQRMGQPQMDHALQAPLPGLGTGPAVSFEDYGAAIEAAGQRSEAQVR